MWECLVKLPDSSLIEIELDSESVLGTELLSQVCRRLDTIETDYFGLQVSHRHGNSVDRHWLNLRNKLKHQLKSTPYRVDFRVKFYVELHHILQDKTRFFIFTNLKHDFKENVLRFSNVEQAVTLAAHIAQALHGNYSQYTDKCLHEHYSEILPTSLIVKKDIINYVTEEHKKLLGVKQKSAINVTLKIASSWEHFGEEYHHVVADGSPFIVGVGPQGIALYHEDWRCESRVPYTAVLKATHNAKTFGLQTTDDHHKEEKRVFKLQSTDASKALYRCVTEMYLFYLCDTVKTDVSSQFCRDLKGTLASIFNEKTDLGKRFVFDIQRTLKEAKDHTRRELLRTNTTNNSLRCDQLSLDTHEPGEDRGLRLRRHSWCGDVTVNVQENHEEKDESFLCQVCMDKDLNTVFIPCGHASCCESCATLMENCPICRSTISNKQHLYLPPRMRHASR